MTQFRTRPKKEQIEISRAVSRNTSAVSQAVSKFTSQLTGKASSTNPAGFTPLLVNGTGAEVTQAIDGNYAILAGVPVGATVFWETTEGSITHTVSNGHTVTFLVFNA
jgi:hypothetical protein